MASFETLKRILKHSLGFQTFLIPNAELSYAVYEIDFLLTTNLPNSKFLYWLDISCSNVSTLCFLSLMPSLEILNVSECRNLDDCDFHVLEKCENLDQLYLSYTNVNPETVVKLQLTVLDLSGVMMKVSQCDKLLNPDMLFFQVSFATEESKSNIETLQEKWIDCSIKLIPLPTSH